MTIVTYTQGKKRFLFSVKGHAGYAEKNDIVCSAVSILGFALMNRLKQFLEDRVQITYHSGEIELEAFPEKGQRQETKAILETIWTGYLLLSEQYPGSVKTERRGSNDDQRSDYTN